MAKKEKEPKTNAVRIVAAKKIPNTLHTYDAPEGFLDGVSVAAQTGQHYVCVIPVACELDLK